MNKIMILQTFCGLKHKPSTNCSLPAPENSRHEATLPLVSPPETSAKIP